MEVTNMLLEEFGRGEEMIQRVEHRKGHDFRYSINGSKLKSLGFSYEHAHLRQGIAETVRWYKDNQNWWRPLKK
jgi:dTDP-glucose 4,6-dehydratase